MRDDVAHEDVAHDDVRHDNARRGMALVFVLWLLVILCATALELRFSSHLKLNVTANMGGAEKALYLARAGVERAIADMAEGRNKVQSLADLHEDDERAYQNVPLGEGAYTLYAGVDEEGDPVYGLIDEAAKINLNTAEREVLAKVPGLDNELAGAIEQLRKDEARADLDGLLVLEGMDILTWYGEDQNHNGILDVNEDDGEESWPPDNADGYLDEGLSACLTTWSASRNVSADGEARINLNEAGAEEITKAVSDVSSQQADSIVAHRDKSKFTSVVELLDVELVERVQEGQGGQQQQGGGPPPEGQQPQQQGEQPANQEQQEAKDSGDSKEGDNASGGEAAEGASKPGNEDKEGKGEGKDGENKEGEKPSQEQNAQEKPATRGTGKKAFDEDTVRRIADRFTTNKNKVNKGLVNINTASAEVLACLPGVDQALAQAIVRERQGRDEGFQTTMDLLDVEGMSADILKKLDSSISARSDVFSVKSFGVLPPGDLYCCAAAVIDRTKEKIRLRYWRELE